MRRDKELPQGREKRHENMFVFCTFVLEFALRCKRNLPAAAELITPLNIFHERVNQIEYMIEPRQECIRASCREYIYIRETTSTHAILRLLPYIHLRR